MGKAKGSSEVDEAPSNPTLDPTELNDEDAKADDFIIKGLAKLDGPKFLVDDTIREELNSMYIVRAVDSEGNEVRRVPKAINAEPDLITIANLIEENQARRDRVTEIKIGMFWLRNELEELWELLEKYLIKKYPFVKAARTKEARYMIVSGILEPLTDRIFAVKRMLAATEMIEKNLGDTHFSLKEIADIGKIVVSRRPLPLHRSA